MDFILSTTHTLPGYKIEEVLGIVMGYSIRTRGALGKTIAAIESIFGGRASSYIPEIDKARKEALDELVNKARELGANAVIGIDFETSELLEGFILIVATGTAVKAYKET